jgi:glutaredoxin
MPTITIYGKPGCHLCDDARAAIRRATVTRAVRVEEVDITVDPGLHARYGERIPVVLLDGELLFEFQVDEGVLERRLARVAT